MLSGLAVALTVGLVWAPPSFGACKDVTFIGAAGSGELKPSKSPAQFDYMGPEVDHMAATLEATLSQGGLAVSRRPDVYRADGVEDLYPSVAEVALLIFGSLQEKELALRHYRTHHLDKYLASIEDGVKGAIARATTAVANCPGTTLVLAGYSQGAMAVHLAERRLAAMGRLDVLTHIGGTLLLGDGDQVSHSKARRFGTASDGAEGIRTALTPGRGNDVQLPATTANICDAHDIVCDFGFSHMRGGVKVHTGYASPERGGYRYQPILAQAANWIAKKILDRSSGVVFEGAPGTGAPPATLGPYAMTPFAPDSQPEGAVGGVAGPTGTVAFPAPLEHELVGAGWATWSNGYSGDVYMSDDSDSARVQLPADTRAFYLYAEPNIFQDFDVTATSSEGTTSGPVSVYGESGARYFGFYARGHARLTEITVTADDVVAIGEFGISK